ncbi:hypothetical protein [Bradyrhizobium sp. RD5-C2]|uniref:hypothetical protein n=1 Tax=Bradyrhizobium sp. RD5-C2 TaxID=244562 RepID=UPI001CC7B1F3|nr:hypothetical protein [Bradyrhizobium sp. RD5-C2]
MQSIFPNWIFSAADTIAANSVNGALLIGTRHAIAPRKTARQRELTTFEVKLYCDRKWVQRGGGSLVLDSPLRALRHLVELLAHDPHNPPLCAGEVFDGHLDAGDAGQARRMLDHHGGWHSPRKNHHSICLITHDGR